MKQRILYFALAAAALLSLGACNGIKEQGLSGERVPLKFSATIGDYSVKATDTSFEQGDEVGLFAGAPLGLANEKLTWNGTALVPAQDLWWPEGASGEAAFRAYYPYNAELKALEGSLPFKVKYDQGEYEDYTASDLMFATAKAAPGDEVKLVFDHKLSKIAVKIVNNTGDPVRNVLLAVEYGTAVVDAAAGEITGAESDPEDDGVAIIRPYISGDSFYAIVPPQTSRVEFVVSTLSGKSYMFANSGTELLSGKQSRGTVTIEAEAEGDKVEFELSIAPWEEGGNIRFSDSEIGARSGYEVYMIGTGERLPMTQTAPGEFFFNFPNYMGESFYVLNENVNYIYGCNLQIPQNVGTWPCVNTGVFQLTGFEGDLNIRFMPDDGLLTYEPVYPEWQHLGEGEVVFGIFSDYYGFIPEIRKAEIYEDSVHPGTYMVENNSKEGVFNSYIELYGNIRIDARDPEKVFVKPIDAYDLMEGRYFSLFSDVVENGEDGQPYGDNNYGSMADGVIRPGYLTARYEDGSETVYNTDRMFQVVLPGSVREPVLGFGYSYDGLREDGNVVYADFTLKPYPDMLDVRYMFFSGKPSNQEILGEIVPDFRSGGGEPVPGIEMGQEFLFSIPITQSGRYTGFFYADAGDGNYWYRYNYFTVNVPDSEFPSGSISLSDAAASALFPDKAATVHADMPYASNIRIRAVSADAAEEAGLTEDDYYSYAMAGDFAPGFMSYFSDNTGGDLAVTDLLPDMDYLIIAAGLDLNGNSSWTSATVHTSSEPTWADFGEGTWTDDSWFTGGYSSPVLIRKAAGAERYRAVMPYAAYWESQWPQNCQEEPETYEGTYAGYSADFEFAFVQDDGRSYIYYLPFRPGYVLPDFAEEGTDTGVIEFRHHNIAEKHPSVNSYVRYNTALSDGVYNIAPCGKILNTAYYYPWMQSTDGWVIAMPGHDYTPAQAPAMKKSRAGKEESSFTVSGEHRVAPFRRLPVKLGKPVVTPVNNND